MWRNYEFETNKLSMAALEQYLAVTQTLIGLFHFLYPHLYSKVNQTPPSTKTKKIMIRMSADFPPPPPVINKSFFPSEKVIYFLGPADIFESSKEAPENLLRSDFLKLPQRILFMLLGIGLSIK